MRLKKISVENYGIFDNREFNFPDNNLIVMYGPNEAGKSTFLQCIRESFFGFKHRMHPYQFGDNKMASELYLSINKKDIHYRREKKTKDAVIGEFLDNGIEIDEDKLLQLFGNINDEIYWNIFGFSLSELSRGEESLKNKEITEVLYSSGMGGVADIDEIHSLIEEEESNLFRPRATKPKLNELIKKIKEKEKEMREYIIAPSNYANNVRELKNKKESKGELDKKLNKINTRLNHIDILLDAREPYIELKNNQEGLKDISLPENIPPDMKEVYDDAKKEIKRLTKESKDLKVEIDDLKRRRDKISFNESLIDEKPELEKLYSGIQRIESAVKDIPKISERSSLVQKNISETLKSIDSKWSLEYLKSFNPEISDRNAFEKLITQFREMDKNRDKIHDKIKDNKEKIDEIKTNLKQEGEIKDLTKLKDLLGEARKYESNISEYHRLLGEKEENMEDTADLWKKLYPLVEKEQNVDFSIPMDSTIHKYEKLFEKKNRDLERLKQELESQDRQLIDEKHDFEKLSKTDKVVDKDDVLEKREYRDIGWNLIKDKYIIDGENVSSEKIQEWRGNNEIPLYEAYETVVKKTDQMADQLYDKSELAAKKEEMKRRIEKQEKLIDNTKKSIDKVKGEFEDIKSKWDEQWKDCGFKPLSPIEMKEWISNFNNLLSNLESKKKLEKDISSLEKDIDDFITEAQKYYPNISKENASDIIDKLDTKIQDSQESNTRINQFKKDCEKIDSNLQKNKKEKESLEENVAQWKENWQALLEKMNFKSDWDIDTADKVLRKLDELKQKMKDDEENIHRLNQMNNAIEVYLSDLKKLARSLKWDRIDEKHPEKTVKELHSLLSEEEEKKREWNKLHDKIEDRDFNLNQKKDELENYQAIINNLFKKTNVTTDEEFLTLISRVEEVNNLNEGIKKNTEYLQKLRRKANLSFEELIDELDTTDFANLELENEQLNTKKEEVKKEWETEIKEYAALENDFKKFDGSAKAAELANDVEFLRAEFDTHMDRYISLIIAKRLLDEAVKRFEKEHQPELLNNINNIFGKITDGSYTQIKTSLDKENPFRVVDKNGVEKTPNQLSTGTREQLYLSIRLGYIEHYTTKSESLPIIMDDVMVNFDDKRARNTAKTLNDISNDKQIILLTCHEHTVNKFQNIDDNIPIVKF